MGFRESVIEGDWTVEGFEKGLRELQRDSTSGYSVTVLRTKENEFKTVRMNLKTEEQEPVGISMNLGSAYDCVRNHLINHKEDGFYVNQLQRYYLAVAFDSGKTLNIAYSGSFPTDDQLAFIGNNLGVGEALHYTPIKHPDPSSIEFILDTYPEGFKGQLVSTDSDLKEKNGEWFTIVKSFTKNDNEVDVNEVGTMYLVRFGDGFETVIFQDEFKERNPLVQTKENQIDKQSEPKRLRKSKEQTQCR